MSTQAVDLGLVRKLNSSALFLAVALFLILAGCDTAEERAEEHYQSALALLEDGDIERALVEFRNVFKLHKEHVAARQTYAKLQRDRGFLRDAYGQYMRLVEQDPEFLEGQIALSEMALENRNWEDLERYSAKAVQIAPDNVKAKSLNNTLKYFYSVRDENEEARKAAVDEAVTLIKQDSGLPSARKVLIDDLVRQSKWEEALAEIDTILEQSPGDIQMHVMRLGILQQTGDVSEMGVQLERMSDQFPENEQIRDQLISFYVSQKDLDAAEEFLREKAKDKSDATAEHRLVSFLFQFRGPAAAKQELERIIADGLLPPVPFQGMLARLNFDQGDRQAAIDSLEAIVKDAERDDEIRNVEIEIARMYFQMGNPVEARRLVEKVLAEDSTHIDASKLKAAWLIQDDETGDAILMLREVMSKAPRDAGLLTLMAQAYEREGNRDLMREMLSLAVEAANKAPAESIRYARALIADEQFLSAESVLIDALRLAPANTDLLGNLGNLYVAMDNWSQAGGVIDRLNELDTEEAKSIALTLQAQSLSAQNRSDELLSMLENVTENPDKRRAAETAIFRTRLTASGPQAAYDYVEGLLKEAPGDPDYLFLKAGALMMLDQRDEAKAIYRELVKDYPKSAQAWLTLYRVERFTGDLDDAKKVLDSALAELPSDPRFQMIQAEHLQMEGDIDGAIEVYEKMYAADTSSVVVANNLASLIADNREDPESLKKAFAIARRLKGLDSPALQDTYGWIAYRMGNNEEALPNLEKAAAGMAQEATVQYHYGMALAADGQKEKALEQLTKSLEMAKKMDPAPKYLDDLNAEIAKLKTP